MHYAPAADAMNTFKLLQPSVRIFIHPACKHTNLLHSAERVNCDCPLLYFSILHMMFILQCRRISHYTVEKVKWSLLRKLKIIKPLSQSWSTVASCLFCNTCHLLPKQRESFRSNSTALKDVSFISQKTYSRKHNVEKLFYLVRRCSHHYILTDTFRSQG